MAETAGKLGNKSKQLIEMLKDDGMSRDAIVERLYSVNEGSSERYRVTAHRNLTRMMCRIKGIGYDLSTSGKKIWLRSIKNADT